ncbi:protein kinase domain-containing protein [Phaeodactylibacter xiamenensis]|uniref:serine/threonine protein kinase n=1 Tax=Phaeodactylibacter xiamenensis TaxID=1524460 RepID=UPI003BAA1E8F
MSWSQGQLFYERFRLERLLGRGGFSEVWKVNDEKARAIAAIKIFIKQDEEGVELCRQEYQKAHNLNHPNILRPTYFDVYKGAPFLVMPYCSQGTLADKTGTLSPEQVLQLFREIASALNYIHTRTNSISHNDIKPDNILIDEEGHFLLTDFGISQRFQQKLTQTVNTAQREAEVVKSGITALAYRAPELFNYKDRTQKPASNPTDIWALGTLLFQTCSGQLPFHGEGGLAQLIGMSDGTTAVSDLVLPLPDFLLPHQKQLILSCLELETWKRPSAKAILETLDQAISPQAASKTPRAGAVLSSTEQTFLDQYGVYVLISIATLLVILAVWAIAGGGKPSPETSIAHLNDSTEQISSQSPDSSVLIYDVPEDTFLFEEDDAYWDNYEEDLDATGTYQTNSTASNSGNANTPKVKTKTQDPEQKKPLPAPDQKDTSKVPPKPDPIIAPHASSASPTPAKQPATPAKIKLSRAAADQFLNTQIMLTVVARSGINTLNGEEFVRSPIQFTLKNQVTAGNIIVIPSGSHVKGVITRASSGKFLAPAQIQIELASITINGQPIAIDRIEINKKGRGGEKDIFILDGERFDITIQPSKSPALEKYIYDLVEY